MRQEKDDPSRGNRGVAGGVQILDNAEDAFRRAFAQCATGVALGDGEGRTVWCNAAFSAITGFGLDELQGRSLLALVHPDDSDENLNLFNRLRHGDLPSYTVDNRYVRQDGGSTWVQKSVSLVRDSAGCPGGIIVLVSDNNAAKRAEEDAQRHVRWLESANQAARLAAFERNLQTGEVVWGPELRALYGIGPEVEPSFDVWLACIHADDREAVRCAAVHSAESGMPFEQEYRVVLPDGSLRWFYGRASVLTDTRGRPERLVGVSMDITGRKRTEEALLAAERRFRRLYDANIVGIVCADAVRVTEANDVFLEMVGRTRADLEAGRVLWRDMNPPEYASADEAGLAQLNADGICLPYEKEYIRQDGSRVSALFGATLLDRDPLRWLGFILDITERKQREAERAEEQRNKDRFLALLGHELRNPLAVLTAVSSLLAFCGDDARRAQITAMLTRQVRILNRLVDDLIDLTRITKGLTELRLEPVDVTHALESAVAAVRGIVEERNHELLLTVSSRADYVLADPVRLEQMVVNLLTNAARYTTPGGRIELSAAREVDQVVIRCRDNGIGIAPEMQTRIFQPFSRSPDALTYPSSGLGMGLPIVQNLARLHGGSISVFSAGADHGSEFTLRLPAAGRPPATATAGWDRPADRPMRVARPLQVFVVDDNHDVALALALELERAGHKVHRFADGEAVQSAAAATRPDAVLLDIGLPGTSGYEVAAALRRQPSLANTLIVAISGFPREADEGRPRGQFDRYFLKPVNVRDLLAVLDEHARATASNDGFRILIIDDNADLAEATREFLGVMGHDVAVAANASQALETARATPPRIVLCDARLPDMPGPELARRLRCLPGMRKALIAILSAFSAADIPMPRPRRGQRPAVDLFLSKPLTAGKLAALLERLDHLSDSS